MSDGNGGGDSPLTSALTPDRSGTTKTQDHPDTNTAHGHRVVVGVDGSDGSNRALEWAAVQAERANELLEIHTIYVPGFLFVPPDEVDVISQRILNEATERARRVAPNVATKGYAHKGEAPAIALIEASEGADMLVVGSRGRGAFLGIAVGSVSQKCTLHAHSAVVVVR